MTWQAHARFNCGDASGPLLQPHQVMISHEDAALHSIKQLDLVRVHFASHLSALLVLECVIDRRQSSKTPSAISSAVLSGGRIQLHPWVFDVYRQLDDAFATLEKAQLAPFATIWLSLLTKFPSAATPSSDNICREMDDSRVDLLFESVRKRHIDLEASARRQLRAAGTLRAPQEGQQVPVRLLGDTYVFRIDRVEESGEAAEKYIQVFVKGWSDATREKEQKELGEELSMMRIEEEGSDRASDASYESELNGRLWQTGFAGYTAFIQDVVLNLALVLKRGRKSLKNDVEMEQIGSHGLLISGVSGVGKSLALVALHRELVRQKIGTWRTDGMSLVMGAESPAFPTAYEYLTHALEQHFPELGSLIGHVTDQTSSTCAGVVLVDDLDVLFQSADGQTADGSNTLIPQLGSALLRLLDELSSCNSRLVVIGTTVSADANVPLVAKRTGRFGKILDLVVPTEQSRRDILRRHLVGLPLRSEEEEASTEKSAASLASRLAALTGGYVAKDLVRICRNAAARTFAESINDGGSARPSVGWTDLLQAQQQVKPSQLRELNVASPGAPADGKLAFAGYAAVQKQLFEFVSWKFHPTAAMSRLGISNASGILLSGPSGCGKTLLVQTLAAQAKVNFVSVKSSELLSKFFGDSEKAVRQLFARARAASPCLLFFDEFDSIAHKRSFGAGDGGSSGGGVYARVLSTFLNEMDGVGSQRVTASSTSHSQGGILVVAATNRKNALDAALVRPGRIDKTIEIGYPTQEDVQDILLLYTRKMPLADDVNIQDLAARPRGSCSFTGADIAAVCKEAAFRALREDIEAKIVRSRHFEAAWDQRAAATPTYMTPLRTKQNPTDV
ncbi:ATPase family associated domain-containing protein lid 3 [Phytophthora infestans]|uniref:ATPase family associated domain-containing protein lid 3 n=1 Tax=Phytophthora infestans TaxID=4787 RepID=A0A833T144_PHYIN|nr:ATPase family associated domain-containing protein lid 3 [Phytophthora infestans]